MELLFDYNILASLLTLTALEIILGIDNVVFIALTVSHLPEKQRHLARSIGLILALLMRIVLLLGVAWIIGLQTPWLNIFSYEFSGKDILMIAGGIFLLYKGTTSIHDEVTGDIKEKSSSYKGTMTACIIQIVIIDFVFSFDSVMTAIGLTKVIMVIIIAMTIAMLVMLFSAAYIAKFIEKYPTLKILSLAFILLIGIFLVGEGLGLHVPKGYIYFSMCFALGVEVLNLMARDRRKKKQK